MAKITSGNAEIKKANPDAVIVSVDAGSMSKDDCYGTPEKMPAQKNKAVVSH